MVSIGFETHPESHSVVPTESLSSRGSSEPKLVGDGWITNSNWDLGTKNLNSHFLPSRNPWHSFTNSQGSFNSLTPSVLTMGFDVIANCIFSKQVWRMSYPFQHVGHRVNLQSKAVVASCSRRQPCQRRGAFKETGISCSYSKDTA